MKSRCETLAMPRANLCIQGAVQLDRSIADFMGEGFAATTAPEGPARNTLAIFDKQVGIQLELVKEGYSLLKHSSREA